MFRNGYQKSPGYMNLIFVWLLVIEVITVIKTSEMRKERF